MTTENDPDMVRLHEVVQSLGEHYDTVHIFATRRDEETKETFRMHDSSGCFLTRYAHIRLWLLRMDAEEKEMARRQTKDEE